MSKYYINKSDTRESVCHVCGKRLTTGECHDIDNFTVRIEPGDEVPSGQCPDCSALCYLTKMERSEDMELLDVVKFVAAAIEKAHDEGKRAPDLVELLDLCRRAIDKREEADMELIFTDEGWRKVRKDSGQRSLFNEDRP